MSDASERHVIIEDETLAAGFTQIPNGILRRADLQPGAKLTYMVLLSYAWQKDHAYPGQDRLAADMGVSERSVITYLKQLQERGLVTVRRRGLGLTNVYVLHRISRGANISDQAGSEKFAPPGVKESAVPEVQDLPPKNTHVKKTNDEEASSPRKLEPTDYDEAREWLLPFVEDFAGEFRDASPISSTLTRVVKLFRRSDLDEEAFTELLYRSRQVTKERTAAVKTGEGGKKNLVPYWLAVLTKLIDEDNLSSMTG